MTLTWLAHILRGWLDIGLSRKVLAGTTEMAGLYSPVLSVSAGYPDHVLLKVMGNGKADQVQSEDTFKASACVMYPYIPLFKARCYRQNV